MVDSETKERILVHTEGAGGPYIMVSVDQLEGIESLLRHHGISFWTDSGAISVDGGPLITIINLGRGVEGEQVQKLLDTEL